MKESQSETWWNEEIRRCGVVDIAEKVRTQVKRIRQRSAESRRRADLRYCGMKREGEDVGW